MDRSRTDRRCAHKRSPQLAPLLVLLVPLLVLGSVFAGCGSGQHQVTGPAGHGVPAPTAVVTTVPTTATSAIAGGCPSGMAAAAQDPAQAAQCLYAAWAAGDRSGAAVFASLDVVAMLFSTAWTPPRGAFLGCSAQSDGGQQCSFDHHGARYLFEVRRSEGGWRVEGVVP